MNLSRRLLVKITILIVMGMTTGSTVYAETDPLPSWNNGATKQAIMEFVKTTTDPMDDGFVPVPERIATFDNDGTLWTEHPMYT